MAFAIAVDEYSLKNKSKEYAVKMKWK